MARNRRRNPKNAFSNTTAPAVPGAGKGAKTYPLPRDQKQQELIRSRDALFGRTTYFTGPTPAAYSTYPGSGLSPQIINAIFREVDSMGWMLRKADLDQQVLQRDSHLNGVDRARRVGVSGKPFRVKPADGSPLAAALAKFVQAAIDDIDGFDRSVYEILLANAAGYACQEVVWKEKRLRLSGPAGLVIPALAPQQLDSVPNRAFRFDVGTDQALLDMGSGSFVELEPHKFLFHVTSGDGFRRQRGYMRSVAWLHLIKHQAIARWATVLEIWGIPVPWGKVERDLYENPERKAEYAAFLQDFGLGKPALTTDDIEVEHAPIPPGLDARGMHASLIGWANSEISKIVQGETLTTEMNVGSYNASETHAAVKEAIIAADAKYLAEDIRFSLFRSILELNLSSLSAALNASPDDILRLIPRPWWRIERESTPMQRVDILDKLVNNLGLKVSQEQVYEEFGIDMGTDGNVVPGKPIPCEATKEELIKNDAPHRGKRIHALGNAVVPQVAAAIGLGWIGPLSEMK